MGHLTARSHPRHHPCTSPVKNSSFASRNPRRDKVSAMGRAYAGNSSVIMRSTYAGIGSSIESRYGIDTKNPMISYIIEMISYEYCPMIHVFDPVEIMKDENPANQKSNHQNGQGTHEYR